MSASAPLAAALLAVLAGALALWATGIAAAAQTLVAAVSRGIAVMFDDDLDDDAKEIAVRRAGLSLLGRSVDLAWRVALALGVAALPVLAAEAAGLAPAAASLAMMLRLDFIAGVSLAAVAIAWAVARLRGRRPAATPGARASAQRPAHDGDPGPYGDGERLVHMLAFASPAVMRGLAALDDRLHARAISKVSMPPPVFVTSLPRAGTTALLGALHDHPDIATHTYRDMPFVTAPALWHRLGGERSGRVARVERAHGDGLTIDLESPEAFDEVLWRLHWPAHYEADRIRLWQRDDLDPRAREVFRRHFAKIVRLRRPGRAASGRVRYLSKNNANIARLGLLPAMFPGCAIVVALRRPVPHAASMLRQHLNFLSRHAEAPFTRRYMRDIGHLEFGALLRPIAFEGGPAGRLSPETPDYWLATWIGAFREIAAHGEGCHLVSQDDLRAQPEATLRALCGAIGLEGLPPGLSGRFRSEPDAADARPFSAALVAEAEALYGALAARRVQP